MTTNKSVIVLPGLSLLIYTMSCSANDEFLQWKQQQSAAVSTEKAAFQEYKDKRDKQFTEFLKVHWKAVDLLKGEIRDKEPKPEKMPIAPIDAVSEESPSERPDISFIEPVIQVPVDLSRPQPVPDITPGEKKLIIDFFGTKISFSYDPALQQNLGRGIDKTAISDHWSALSQTNYESLLGQLDKQREYLQLNDWGYASLVNKLATQVNLKKNNETALLSWFLLAKSGYKARIAYDDSGIYLLVPTLQPLYEVTYFTFAAERFYAITFDGEKLNLGRVFTYDGEYPETTKVLDMRVTSTVAAGSQSKHRHLSFDFEGNQYDIEVPYDRGRIDFFSTYPQLPLDIYFASGVYKATASPLEQQLSRHVKSMSEQQAVNFLLRFVQTAFKYETDEQQFGKENYLFPEETLFYPYSDCEDRAVLFAWLVKRLLDLDVIGLDYPGHVATAVRFNEAVDGDSIAYEGKRYVVSDPTYINARAGMSMPKFQRYNPDVILY